MDEDFAELLLRAKGGEPGALNELHTRYEKRVLGVVRRRLSPALRCRFDSTDVVQSVFEDVIRDLPRFEDRGEEAFRHWLYMKAENKVRDAWRKRLRPDGGLREERLDSKDDGRPAASRGPATQAGEGDDVARLRDVLATLDPPQREVIELRDIQGLSFAAIAERLDLPGADAARMRYTRALLVLRRKWNR